jgi:hypothetical protein
MQRQIVKHRHDPAGLEKSNQGLVNLQGGKNQVVHVMGLLAGVRHEGATDVAGCGPVAQLGVVALPDVPALLLNFPPDLQLTVEERGQEIRSLSGVSQA